MSLLFLDAMNKVLKNYFPDVERRPSSQENEDSGGENEIRMEARITKFRYFSLFHRFVSFASLRLQFFCCSPGSGLGEGI